MKHLLNHLPFTDKKEITTLVENRRAFTLNNFELNVYETYQESKLVPLKFNDLVIINMLKGKKVMHLFDRPHFDYLPGETIVVPPSLSMKIDFPEAKESDPTQCTALAIGHQKIQETINYLNEYFPRQYGEQEWRFHYDQYHFYNNAELAYLTNKLFDISLSKELHKDVLADLTLKELLIRIMQTQNLLVVDGPVLSSNNRLQAVTEFIQNNIHENITVEHLSKKANMSKPSFYRTFKEETGISPMEYVIRERIKNAKKVLQNSKSIKEACYASGFSNINYFVRMFKKQEGITPGVFLTMS
ncbi:helix-turn-helix domain-containing protein [Sphingobacterium spiritivorum]|uniref:Transcriptional regulator, AraC family n=1 Tax=Sphingobacterium spiritivorum ATCC 33861 TaxID=525373 RepID=D7VJ61_SPHSI|nr:AraC family transcriptional regulator [Sphingobacterium spiritivorum]EFK58914.1 transcriptional regulator, AraC family [Sphingobacterium spiritivorum ATCC 33861]QQT36776.1 AraC family transcriptional regulator [Sphingobacterium spiritivorum]WQD33532.1 AraC family transcriptional regulator [Sphingobacterium spiritivorum]SUJ24772.1 Methylphosphotriester-DNA--protein-cysteine S-methyltransferase [Sphingobacterium spiritivorum]